MSYQTVVCGRHSVRYPAAWRSCPHCLGSNQSVVNGQVHDTDSPRRVFRMRDDRAEHNAGDLHNCEGCGARYDAAIADDECPVCDRPRTLPELEWEIVPLSESVRVVEVDDGPRVEFGEGVLEA